MGQSGLDSIVQSSRQQLIMQSKVQLKNNQSLLEDIIARKMSKVKKDMVTKLELSSLHISDHEHNKPEDEEKMLQIDTNRVQYMAQEYLRNFNSLKTTFSAVPSNRFYKQLSTDIKDNMRHYSVNQNSNLTEEEKKYGFTKIKKLKQIIKSNIDFDKFAADFESEELELIKYKNLLKEAHREEIKLLKDKSKLESEIFRIEQHKKSLENINGQGQGQEVIQMTRFHHRNLDVVDQARQRGLRSLGSLINPVFVMKAQLVNMDKPITAVRKSMVHYNDKIQILKNHKNQRKRLILDDIDFILSNPQFLDQLKNQNIRLQKCIVTKIRLGESVYPIQIKGNFIDPEKNYLIDNAKISMM